MIPAIPERIEYIQTRKDLRSAIRHLLRFDQLGFDVETYNKLDHNLEAFEPWEGARMRLAQFATPKGRAFVFDLYALAPEDVLYPLFPNQFECVIHNATFELRFLMYELGLYKFGRIHDTMLAEQIMAKGRVSTKNFFEYVPVSLEACVERHLGIKLSKQEQASAWYKQELSESQIKYAALDAQIVLPLADIQSKTLLEQRQVRVAEVEFDAVPASTWMQVSGIAMDTEAWVKRCEIKKQEVHQYEEKLYRILGSQQAQGSLFEGARAPIKVSSNAQMMEALEKFGVKIPVDKDGKRTIKTKMLESQRDIPVVDAFCKYVKVNKALTSYGFSWLDKVNPFDGKLHTKIKQIGAETGRMSSPDMLVIPKDDLTRNCFHADPGWVLVDADYSQCELRILAELSRDKNLLTAFDEDKDLHRFSGHLIFQVPFDEVTSEQRGIAKNLNFGIVYGIGAKKFANDANIPEEEGQRIMDFYLKNAYPDMGRWLDRQALGIFDDLQARTMLGRIRHYSLDLRDKQQRAAVQRNAKNLPIQGTNADITKRAMALIYKEIISRNLHGDIKMLLAVHDQIILMARPWLVYVAQNILKGNMLKAEQEFFKRVPAKVDCGVMVRWSKEPNDELQKEAQDLIDEYKGKMDEEPDSQDSGG